MIRFGAHCSVAIVSCCWLGATGAVSAHGDVDQQIVEMNRQIERAPDDPALYLHRGELHRIHGDWPGARADYDKAAALAPDLPAVHFARGRLFLAAGALGDAKKVLDRLLTTQPDHIEGLVTRGRVLRQSGELLAAAADFGVAIAKSAQPEPDFYLERAEALAGAGGEHLDEALKTLDEGVERLGQPITLLLLAIEIELRAERFDSALQRVDKICARSPRKETWLTRRGEILERAGRADDARAAFRAALAALDALPEHRRRTKSMVDLRARLEGKVGASEK